VACSALLFEKRGAIGWLCRWQGYLCGGNTDSRNCTAKSQPRGEHHPPLFSHRRYL